MNQVQLIATIILGLIAVFLLFPPYCGATERFGDVAAYKDVDFDLGLYPNTQLAGSKCNASSSAINKKEDTVQSMALKHWNFVPTVVDKAGNERRAELIELIEAKRNDMLNNIFPDMNQFVPAAVANRMN